MSNAEFLITGASGRTGGAAINELLAMGKKVRAYLRTEGEKAVTLRARGVEVAIGDFTDIDSIRTAMEGVQGAYFLYPIRPGILDATVYFAQAAKEAGVQAIANMSQISARRDASSNAARDHWIAEQVFGWSGIPTTQLRPTFFSDWLIYPHFSKGIWANKKIEFPFANGRHAPIASEDIGRVVAHVLANPQEHGGKSYDLRGPIEVDFKEIGREMGEVLGARICYEPISIADFKAKLESMKFPSFLIQHLGEVAQDYQNGGIFSGANNRVETITGTRALTISEFVEKHREAFA